MKQDLPENTSCLLQRFKWPRVQCCSQFQEFGEHHLPPKKKPISFYDLRDKHPILRAIGTQVAARMPGTSLWLNRYPPSSKTGYCIFCSNQASETWTALRTTAQYYMDLGSFAYYPETARDQIQSYMEMLQQSGTHFQQQMTQHN
ncbi:uncharacterized protein C3orf85 homolog isoform X1 [Heteronotia binoei]|uniref:uncharacterized protein C3orf85 homolog isoform X1 n=1 Tax=Heteronotia binoei TaxID=13085 RepID=UPI002930747C|nr:uncharacterized protein C3orf85 homolog isoform X1 [Heteronotia binoei]